MQAHTKIYLNYFDNVGDYLPCEICKSPVVDIHHIRGRGKGKDNMNNLAGLCRSCHFKCTNNEISKDEMQRIHNIFMETY